MVWPLHISVASLWPLTALYYPPILEMLSFSVYSIVFYLLGFASDIPSERLLFLFLVS